MSNTKDTPMDYKQMPHEQLQQVLSALESETIPMTGHQDPGAIKDCWRLASDLVEEIINDSSHLAAVTCPHAYGDEWGNQRCSEIDRIKLELQKQKDEFNDMRNNFHQINKQLMDDLVKQKELNAELVKMVEFYTKEIKYLKDVNRWDEGLKETKNEYANATIRAYKDFISSLESLIKKSH